MVLEYDGRAIAFVILGSTKTKRFEDIAVTLYALSTNFLSHLTILSPMIYTKTLMVIS